MLKKTIIIIGALALASSCAKDAASPEDKPERSRAYGKAMSEGKADRMSSGLTPAALPTKAHPAPSMSYKSARRPRGAALQSLLMRRGGTARIRGRRAFVGPGRRPVPIVKKNTEHYTHYGINPFVSSLTDARSTFAIDVDTASYAICRRKLRAGQRPPASAVRVEEFVNYFNYGYQAPAKNPFLVHIDGAPSPFERGRYFLRIGIQGKQLTKATRKPVHLTFLVDTSGSMRSADKLPLAKRSLRILINQLKKGDTVAFATYAGDVRQVLAPTGIENRAQIEDAIYALTFGGGTAMNDGMKVAYQMASKSFVKGHVNRVLVLSDGDANIGRTGWRGMLAEIKRYADKGITLSTIGFGMGNYKDTRMEQLANKGNGNYYYVDGLSEARKIFAGQVTGTLQVIAKDVKVQVVFNPALVAKHRLVGYENRKLAHRDFDDDKVDAGELGAGHTVTALYEIVLRKPGQRIPAGKAAAFRGKAGMLALVRLRHKAPQTAKGAKSQLIEGYFPKRLLVDSITKAARSFKLALAVAAFGEKLRGSPHAKEWTLIGIAQLAEKGIDSKDPAQAEFLKLVQKAKALGI
jgi:Ca-activated chloride channel family protein